MIILGLTGSIGMGKSTAAEMLRRMDVPVFDADAASRALTKPQAVALKAIDEAFPGVVHAGVLDRMALGEKIFGDAEAKARLEAILHPMVEAQRRRWLAKMRRRGERVVVLEIPLLFETGGERMCDKVIVVTAPEEVQRQRVLARPGMTAEKLARILAGQMSDAEKRRRADWVIDTSHGKNFVRARLRAILRQLKNAPKARPRRGI